MNTEDGKNMAMGLGGSGLTNKPTLAKESGGLVKEENVDQSKIRADVSDTKTISGAGDKVANNWGEQKPIGQ